MSYGLYPQNRRSFTNANYDKGVVKVVVRYK
jgi:hypothetical protein